MARKMRLSSDGETFEVFTTHQAGSMITFDNVEHTGLTRDEAAAIVTGQTVEEIASQMHDRGPAADAPTREQEREHMQEMDWENDVRNGRI